MAGSVDGRLAAPTDQSRMLRAPLRRPLCGPHTLMDSNSTGWHGTPQGPVAAEVLPSRWPSSQPCPTSRQAPASPCRPRSPVAAPMGAQLQDSDREAGSQTAGETVGQQGAQEATRGPAPAYTQLDPQPLTLVPRATPPGRPPDHCSESPALRRRHLGHAGLNFSSTKRPGPSLMGCLGGSGGGAWCLSLPGPS